jgi:putative flavoprotein involved in K+ transport
MPRGSGQEPGGAGGLVPAVSESEHMHVMTDRHEVIVVGGGQSGLAAGYFLSRQGRKFKILEAAEEPATAWRARWDSLKLFTSARYSALPGLAFPGDPDRYPTRDEVVSYLTEYARRFEFPVGFGSRVRSLTRSNGSYLLKAEDRTYEADQVVVATGPFQTPRVPALAKRLDPAVVQLHSSAYRNPSDIPQGPVLIVGGGNSGFQIAEELAALHETHLSVGSRQTPLPQRVLGRDLFWYLEATGLIRKTVESRIGRRLSGRDTLIGSTPRALRRRHDVQLHPRAVGADGSMVRFSDGAPLDVGAVIWATGYTSDYSWIDVPVLDERGGAVHRRGVTDSPGLYFLGLTWQYTRGSALIGWVKDDAEFIAENVKTFEASALALEETGRADRAELAHVPASREE